MMMCESIACVIDDCPTDGGFCSDCGGVSGWLEKVNEHGEGGRASVEEGEAELRREG